MEQMLTNSYLYRINGELVEAIWNKFKGNLLYAHTRHLKYDSYNLRFLLGWFSVP